MGKAGFDKNTWARPALIKNTWARPDLIKIHGQGWI
jgi:hypothetical protein